FLASGYTPTLTGNLADGATLSGSYTSGGIHSRVNGRYFKAANFAPEPLFDPNSGGDGSVAIFWDLCRHRFRGPYQQNWDFSLLKTFQLTERINLHFTTDFFNIWNHASFANPQINDVETIGPPCSVGTAGCGPDGFSIGSPFGKIFSTVGTPRLIQFSLRLAF